MDVIKKFEPLFGEWYAESLIGKGSYGRVYKVYKDELGHRYHSALKYISIPIDKEELDQLRSDGMDAESISTYYTNLAKDISSEITLMNQLRGTTNIVSFEDSKVIPHSDGVGYDIFIRMELLQCLIARTAVSPLTKTEILKMGTDICSALVRCRKNGIVHRDIKPDNIFISPGGDYKLGDFGIARTLEKSTAYMSKKGTPNYMAPEVYKGEPYGAACDIYSLGLVLYRYFNKSRLPFLPDYPKSITPKNKEDALMLRLGGQPLPAPCEADPDLAAIILKACAYRPEDRYATADEMLKALNDYVNNVRSEPDDKAAVDPGSTIGVDGPGKKPNGGSAIGVDGPGKKPDGGSTIGVDGPGKSTGGGVSQGPEQFKYCPECGAKMPLSGQFCPSCGYHLSGGGKPKDSGKGGGSGSKKGLIIGIAAGLVVLLGAAAAVWFLLLSDRDDKGPHSADNTEPAVTEQTADVTEDPATAAPTVVITRPPTTPPTEEPTVTPTATPEPTPEPVVFNDSKFEAAFRAATKLSGPIYEEDLLAVETLIVTEKGLTDISDVAKLVNLRKFDAKNNSISDISPIAGLTNLTWISFRNNKVTDISALEGLKNLEYAGLGGNTINDLRPLAGLKNLTELYLHTNNIYDVGPLSGLSNLRILRLYGNHISNIEPLRNLTGLTELKLHKNSISDLSPLQYHTNLVTLTLSENQISNIYPLQYLAKLEDLDLKSNNISSIYPLLGLTRLKKLDVSGNPISSDQLLALQVALGGCEIIY